MNKTPSSLSRGYNRDPNIKALKGRGVIKHGSTSPRTLNPKVVHEGLAAANCTTHFRISSGLRKAYIPEPQKYEEQWPFGLYLAVLGYCFTYFWGPRRFRVMGSGLISGLGLAA